VDQPLVTLRRWRPVATALVGGVMAGLVMVAGSVASTGGALVESRVLTAAAVVEPDGGYYRWPLGGPVTVARRFEPPARRWLPGHRGVDLVGTGDIVVRAAGDGVVRFAGPVAGRGVVSIDHPAGLRTTYEPLVPLVSAGEPVARGDPIGVLVAGHAGCPAETCLHWGVRQGPHYLDPLALLSLGRARLLPP
jgi:murein DD-endopeptidase MepM/ murein hydrolase activator NlpD